MDHVIRVLLERADARRQSLLGLAEAIPADFWTRRAPGQDWTAAQHLAHAFSADSVLTEIAPRFAHATVEELASRRQAAIESALALPRPSLLASASTARAELRRVLESLAPPALESTMMVPAAPGTWGETTSLSLFAYLHAWAGHDPEHELAIREAIATTPDLSAVAHVRRLR